MAEIHVAPQIQNDDGTFTDVKIQTDSSQVFNTDGTTVQSHVDNSSKHITKCSHVKIGTVHNLSDDNIGTVTGSNVTINGTVNTSIKSLIINGSTTLTGTGIASPNNLYTITGVVAPSITINDVVRSTTIINALYSMSDGVKDTVNITTGIRTNYTGLVKFVGNETWSIYSTSDNSTSVCFYVSSFTNRLASSTDVCNEFTYKTNLLSSTTTDEGYWLSDVQANATLGYFRVNKSRLIGWSDSLSDVNKIALFKTWLSSYNLIVLYELLTPTTSTETIQEFRTADTTTNVSIDKGSFTLVYFKDMLGSNTISFQTTADFTVGDTWKINGSQLIAKMINGNALYTNVFKSGGFIVGKIDGSNLLISITDGGNSDTVDGKHSSDFVPKVIGCTGSCDGYFQTGVYQGIFTNYPPSLPDGQGNLIVHSYSTTSTSAGWTQQEFVSAQTSVKNIRKAVNGVWESWGTQYSSLNIGTASVLNADTVDGIHAADLGGMYVGIVAPTAVTKGWIDTANGGILKYFNGTAWVAAKGVWG